jgi:hypothetical protein
VVSLVLGITFIQKHTSTAVKISFYILAQVSTNCTKSNVSHVSYKVNPFSSDFNLPSTMLLDILCNMHKGNIYKESDAWPSVCVSDKIINLRTSVQIVTKVGMNIMPLAHTYGVAVTLALLPKCSKHHNSSNHITNSNKSEHCNKFSSSKKCIYSQMWIYLYIYSNIMCSWGDYSTENIAKLQRMWKLYPFWYGLYHSNLLYKKCEEFSKETEGYKGLVGCRCMKRQPLYSLCIAVSCRCTEDTDEPWIEG